MPVQAGGKGHKGRKIGRDKVKCQAYLHANQRARNKIKRIAQSCGQAFAHAWSVAFGHGVRVPLPAGRHVSIQPN